LVHGIRLQYSWEGAAGPPDVRVGWRGSGHEDFTEEALSDDERRVRSYAAKLLKEPTVTVRVDDTIDAFRIHLGNKPGALKVTKLTLLVPAADAARAAAGGGR
jgi:hypothetical protein